MLRQIRQISNNSVIPSIDYDQFEQPNKQDGKKSAMFSSKYDSIYKQQYVKNKNMDQIRTNFLNSQYNRRKQSLKQITKENMKIYTRINSQKSVYSTKNYRKTSFRQRSFSKDRVNENESGVINQYPKSRLNEDSHRTINYKTLQQIKKKNIEQFETIFLREKEKKRGYLNQNRSFKRPSLKQRHQNIWMGQLLDKMTGQFQTINTLRIV